MNKWKKEPKPSVDDLIEDVKNRAQKDEEGKPILTWRGRRQVHRSGTPSSRKFSEKMAIPRTKR